MKGVDDLVSVANEVYGGKVHKKVAKMICEYASVRFSKSPTLELSLMTYTGKFGPISYITDDRGHVIDGLVSVQANTNRPEDIDTVTIDIAMGSLSLKGIKS